MAEKKTPGVKEVCDACNGYLHCCKNCRHHDVHAHNQCLIPTTDWVGAREGPNFCDEFDFRHAEALSVDESEKASARNALNALFGDDSTGQADPMSKFKNLFGE